MVNGKVVQGLFNTQDEAIHRALRRPVAGVYSMTNLVEFEPYVDTTIQFLVHQLDELEVRGKPGGGVCDETRDVDGIIESIWKIHRYACTVCFPLPSISQLSLDKKLTAITNHLLGRANAMDRRTLQEVLRHGLSLASENISYSNLYTRPRKREDHRHRSPGR
jgi:hypothetical protein